MPGLCCCRLCCVVITSRVSVNPLMQTVTIQYLCWVNVGLPLAVDHWPLNKISLYLAYVCDVSPYLALQKLSPREAIR